jgi:hypothetical protein
MTLEEEKPKFVIMFGVSLEEEFLAIEETIKWLEANAAKFKIPEHYAKYLASNLARQKDVLNTLTIKKSI